MKATKAILHQHLIALLDSNIDAAEKAIESAKEARNEDTKSSAGDKYETGREMMQIEIDKAEFQKGKSVALKNDLARIDLQKACIKVEFGSLVRTAQGSYFISIGLGKLTVDGETCYAISLASPIGKLLSDKRVGDLVQFQGKEFKVEAIS